MALFTRRTAKRVVVQPGVPHPTAPSASAPPGQREARIVELGSELLERARKHKSGLLSRAFWSDKLMDWAMKDHQFKVQLFRFVDCFPVIRHDPDLVHEILVDYLSQPGVKLPTGFGSLVSAVFVCGTIMVLAYKPGYVAGPDTATPLAAPQANMMASALESFLGTGAVPWLLYGIGVVVALTVNLVGVSPLAFGLGMYLPMYVNTPILIGALVSTLVKKGGKDEKLAKARSNKGILIASGLIAGGAIMEVLVNFTGALDDLVFGKTIMPLLDMSGRMLDGGMDPEGLARTQNWLGLILFLALCVFVYFDCRRAKPELAEGGELH